MQCAAMKERECNFIPRCAFTSSALIPSFGVESLVTVTVVDIRPLQRIEIIFLAFYHNTIIEAVPSILIEEILDDLVAVCSLL